jgi:hypothetical protein
MDESCGRRLAPHPPGGGVAADDLLVDEHPQHFGGIPPLRLGGGEHVGCGGA